MLPKFICLFLQQSVWHYPSAPLPVVEKVTPVAGVGLYCGSAYLELNHSPWSLDVCSGDPVRMHAIVPLRVTKKRQTFVRDIAPHIYIMAPSSSLRFDGSTATMPIFLSITSRRCSLLLLFLQ